MVQADLHELILIGCDRPEDAGGIVRAASMLGWHTRMVPGIAALGDLALTADTIAVVSDGGNGHECGDVARELRELHHDLPIVVVSSNSSHRFIVGVLNRGANDVLIEPVTPEALSNSIDTIMREREAIQGTGADALSKAAWTRKSEAFVQSVGPADMPVLILGETGVGKDVLARQLHAASRRANKPLLKLNCAAMPSELVESELFGYERGAFTGAMQRKPGMFEMADGGTLLLDEIGDMDARLQAKLLQVLQDKTFQRLGGRETVSVDVRVLAATHRDLEKGIIEGTFREDLYYRLNVISIKIPPLRERTDEVLPLAAHFLEEFGEPGQERPKITPALADALVAHEWRGNIRELSNVMRRYLVFRDAEAVMRQLSAKRSQAAGAAPAPAPAPAAVCETAPAAMTMAAGAAPAFAAGAAAAVAYAPEAPSMLTVVSERPRSGSVFERMQKEKQQAEAEAILATLNATRWNRVKAAEQLGLQYKALLYKMRKLGITAQPSTAEPAGPALLRRSG